MCQLLASKSFVVCNFCSFVLSNRVGCAGEALVRNVINAAALSNVFADRNDLAIVAVVDVRRVSTQVPPRLYARTAGKRLLGYGPSNLRTVREPSRGPGAMPCTASDCLHSWQSQSGSSERYLMSLVAVA